MDRDSAIPCLYADEGEEEEPTMGGGAAVRDLRVEPDAVEEEPTGFHLRFDVASGGRTDTGMKRRTNEDAMLILEGKALYVVADGMGGHAGGAVASRLAVEAMAAAFADTSTRRCLLTNVPARGAELVEGFATANEAIRSAASKSPRLADMGTTVVAAVFSRKKGRAYIGHVGDSRCYRLRNGSLEQLTRDHTLAELGVFGPDAKRLSRAVGTNGIVEADLVVVAPRDGDVFLLCSDGLNKTLSDETILDVLRVESDPREAADALVSLANEEGARDNVTAVVVRISSSAQRSS